MNKQKLITVMDRAYILTSRGKCLGPIFPFLEYPETILSMIESGAEVIEVLSNGKGVILTKDNYNKDNSKETPTIILVTSVEIDKKTSSCTVGDKFKLTANAIPKDATDTTIVWGTEDAKIATVTQTGEVTTIAEGTVNITASSKDGGKRAICTVTVTAPVKPTK